MLPPGGAERRLRAGDRGLLLHAGQLLWHLRGAGQGPQEGQAQAGNAVGEVACGGAVLGHRVAHLAHQPLQRGRGGAAGHGGRGRPGIPGLGQRAPCARPPRAHPRVPAGSVHARALCMQGLELTLAEQNASS